MVLVAFGELADAGSTGLVEPATNSSEDIGPGPPPVNSTSASIPTGPTDSPGGPSPPPGSVNAAYAPSPPITSALPGPVVPPRLDNSTGEYRYRTVAGIYAFPKAAPYLLRYEAIGGAELVKASTFLVLSPGVTLFESPEVLDATNDRYAVRFHLGGGSGTVGNVTITYDFFDDRAPKITAELKTSGSLASGLLWVALTVDAVASNGTAQVDFASLTWPAEIATPEYRIGVGPDLNPAAWKRRLVLDWSDAQAGRALVGPFSAGGLRGAAVLVRFPDGMAVVDPQLVGDSREDTATQYPIQRKAFSYAGRFWAFWYDVVSNSVKGIAYSSSRDGVTWTSQMFAASATVLHGFDVD